MFPVMLNEPDGAPFFFRIAMQFHQAAFGELTGYTASMLTAGKGQHPFSCEMGVAKEGKSDEL